MSHELTQLADGTYSMLRSADTNISWHGLETVIPADAGFDTWAEHPVFNWKINRSKVRYAVSRDPSVALLEMPSQHVLFRSDNHKPLSTVSEDYHIVQPKQVLEFFRDLCETNHLTMDTAGVLQGGKRVWALARTGNEINVGGLRDIVKQYVLLSTSYDTTMSTVAKQTSQRVVCRNTLDIALSNGEPAVRVRHASRFNEVAVKIDLGLLDSEFSEFGSAANEMAKVVLSVTDAQRWFAELLLERVNVTDEEVAEVTNRSRLFKGVWESYTKAPGSQNTAWGAVNAITHLCDHVRGRSVDTRMNSAWFGSGKNLKLAAWKKAVDVINSARAANDVLASVAA